ncbi:MAG: hypothetical protein HZB29_14350 [Nitrospinae bacterium]|nr:hypothetical protein [Nitrospinota bacterium]
MTQQFDLQRYLQEGWELFRAHAANMVVATLILVVVNAAANLVPFASLLVAGPMTGGMFYVIMDLMEGKEFAPARMFDGFKLFVPMVLVSLLSMVFITAGFIALVIPGFLVAGWYLFPYLFVIDKGMGFWDAMEASRKIGFENHLSVFLMALVLAIINVIGAVALFVGLLVTIPVSFCATVAAYRHLTGVAQTVQTQIIPPPPPPPAA